ncbi:MFS transporter [Rhizobium sp. CNPSo 4039]|uniref:MFS transporter n=1 Tax=Rhizobium sp. CNPSo 4039 TaxID=3021409 RepID=UPI00254A98B1|nr:MFS transporter [Rhizobium sp. CNPSo 4039]MDK4717509.1 MFS transporter [Rhizobium sp. CNPSo 4039]
MKRQTRSSSRGSEETRKFLVLMSAGFASSLIMLDSNIVAVSLPSIARTLGATFTEIEWVVSAYVLAFAALLLAAGSYADRHGRKLAMLAGLVIFTISSAICGLATSALMLNLARAVQGVGASLLLTASLAVINHTFTGAERARAYAFWGACLGIAITCGPIIGGVITDFFGWRWAFLINLPICAVLIVAACLFVEESSDHEAKKLDFPGIVTFSAGLFLLIWASIDGNNLGWFSQAILLRLLGALVFLIAFYWIETKEERPMIDFGLFRQPTFLGSAFAMLGYAIGAQVLIFFLPLFLQNSYGLAPAVAGLAMLPFALPMFLTPRFGAGLASQYSGRALLTLGFSVTTLGDLLLYLFAETGAAYPLFAVAMVLAGAGAGLLNSETAKVMQGAVPPQRAGMGSGISATTRFVGLLFGVAGLGAVLSHGVNARFVSADAVSGMEAGLLAQAAKRVASGDLDGVISVLGDGAREAVRSAAQSAFAGGFGDASLSAAFAAAFFGILTYSLVRAADTTPNGAAKDDELAPAME